jgi:hypothetical protein
MRSLGVVLLVGGFLIKLFTFLSNMSFIAMGVGVAAVSISYLIRRNKSREFPYRS